MSYLDKIAELTGKLNDRDAQLQKQTDRLTLVIESCDLGIWDWNPQTNEVVFNDQWGRMLGYEPDEVEPCLDSWKLKVHPDDIGGCFEDIGKHIRGEIPMYSNTHRMKHKDGHWVIILDRGRIVERNEYGDPIRFTGTHTYMGKAKEENT